MSKLGTAFSLLTKNRNIFVSTIVQKVGFLFSDEKYLQLLFKYRVGYPLNLKDPQTYNEKIQWLKLYNQRPEYQQMVDKYEVKKYIASKIGDEYVIPTYGVWDDINSIEWISLPEQYVIKTTNGGGGCGVVICKDRAAFDKAKAVKELRRSISKDIYKELREWPYKNMRKRIIAEMLLEEKGEVSPRDYKVMCFDGKAKLIEYHEGRFSGHHTQDFYDTDWNITSITQGSYGAFNTNPSPKPDLLEEMIRLSEILAKNIPHVRVDWYIVNNHLYFGELTFFDGSGLGPWDRYEDDLLMGSWITLPKKVTEEKQPKDLGVKGIDMFY